MKIKIDTIDKLFSKLLRAERGRTCERCGKKYPERTGLWGLHTSHFIGRANKQVRWNKDNADILCMGCHSYFETHKATLYREWKMDKLGAERYNALIEKSRETTVITEGVRKAIKVALKLELKEYD